MRPGAPAGRCKDRLYRTGHAFPAYTPVKGARLAGVARVPILAFPVLGHWEGSRAMNEGGREEGQGDSAVRGRRT